MSSPLYNYAQRRKPLPYDQSPAGLDPDLVGATAPAPGPENAWGAIVAPTIDPSRRPDVLNADGSQSSLLSSSFGTKQGDMLAPGVTQDGRELDDDAAGELARQSGQHLGIYSSRNTGDPTVDHAMADQAAEAMHNEGMQQQLSPSYSPTSWNRADQPGVNYPSQAARAQSLQPPIATQQTVTPAQSPTPQPSQELPQTDLSQPPNALDPYSSSQYPYGGALSSYAQRGPQLPEPPKANEPSPWALGGAALLDVFLNRGRHAGEILSTMAQGGQAPMIDYKNQLERAKSQAQIDHLYAQAGEHRRYGDSPEALDLRRQNLELQRQRLGLGLDREGRLHKRLEQETDPVEAERDRKLLVDLGADPALVEGLNKSELKQNAALLREHVKNNPQMRGQAASTAGAKAKAVAEATAPIKIAVAGKSAEATSAARLPSQKALQDHSVATADAKGANATARKNANAGTQDVVRDFNAINHHFMVNPADRGHTYTRLASNPRTANALKTTMETVTRTMDAPASLQRLNAEYEAMSPLDRVKEHGREVAKEYQMLRQEHQGMITKISGQGAGAQAERHEIKAEIPDLNILGVPGSHNPLAAGQLTGIDKMLHTNVKAITEPNGIILRDENALKNAQYDSPSTGRAQPQPTAARAPSKNNKPAVDDFF